MEPKARSYISHDSELMKLFPGEFQEDKYSS